jgi:hypothetical protein
MSNLNNDCKVTISLKKPLSTKSYTGVSLKEIAKADGMYGEGLQYYFINGRRLSMDDTLYSQGVKNGDLIYFLCMPSCKMADHDAYVEKFRLATIPKLSSRYFIFLFQSKE